PQRGHGIAPSIGVDQSFQCLKQLGVTLDQRLASGSGVPDSPNGEGALRKALDGPIDGRARKTSNAGDDGNTSSSQLLGVERSDQMLLSLIQVRKQRVEFMLTFFCCAHASSIAQRALCVSVIFLRALTPSFALRSGSTARTVGYSPGPCPRTPRSARSTTSAISEDWASTSTVW